MVLSYECGGREREHAGRHGSSNASGSVCEEILVCLNPCLRWERVWKIGEN